MDYQQAAKIRKKSFGTLLAEQEGGFGHSLKAAISQKTKARMEGLKESFDPLNIAKKLTGGSNWAPALLGKLFGIDKKRTDYFSGVKGRTPTASLSEDSLDSPEALECLGYIYKSLKQSIEDKKLADEEKLNRLEEENEEEETRNQEIIKAITGRVSKKKQYRDEKGRFTKAPKEKPEPTETPSVFKQNPARLVKPSVTVPTGIGTATAIGGAAIIAGVGGTLGISQAIAKGESAGGSYNAANKGTKNGKIIGVKEKVNLEDMTVAEIMRRQAIKWGSPNESEKLFAVGKYQMIPDTLAGAVKSMNIDVNQKFTGALQEKMFEQYLIGAKQPAVANYLNSPVDDPTLLYKALKGLSNEWASIADPDIPGGKTSHYGSGNKASVSVETMSALLRQDRETLQKNKKQNLPSETNTGIKIDTASKENKNLKADIKEESTGDTSVVNNTITSKQTTSPAPQNIPKGDDSNAYQKKAKL